ncbi:MAG: Ribosome-binding ATPase YchF [Chlamydiia bacterium]|nr:Ribosome-binding ATPase YchF [Chlamydiia bacterium]
MSETQLSCGIVGLPNVGKSTLFNALIKKMAAEASNYPFCTIDPNVGIVDVPDARLEVLSSLSKSKKIIPASISFVDIAGLVKGASKGEGLGNKFLANIRETDAIVHVVRCFEDENIVHVDGKIDPISDIEVINLELILADIQMAENSLVKLEKQARGKKDGSLGVETMKKVIEHLSNEKPLRSIELTEDERESIKLYNFITDKKVIYAANVAEDSIPAMHNDYVQKVIDFAKKENSLVVPICAKLEEELAQLSEVESQEYLETLGLKEPGLSRLIKTSFSLLDLITFLTTGEQETRAWTIREGTKAPQAAGKIHTDIEKGFIRAETITYGDFESLKSRAAAKDAGKARMEGKDYIVKDGDVILFFHN